MKKFVLLGTILMGLLVAIPALAYSTVFNPFTQKLDYVGCAGGSCGGGASTSTANNWVTQTFIPCIKLATSTPVNLFGSICLEDEVTSGTPYVALTNNPLFSSWDTINSPTDYGTSSFYASGGPASGSGVITQDTNPSDCDGQASCAKFDIVTPDEENSYITGISQPFSYDPAKSYTASIALKNTFSADFSFVMAWCNSQIDETTIFGPDIQCWMPGTQTFGHDPDPSSYLISDSSTTTAYHTFDISGDSTTHITGPASSTIYFNAFFLSPSSAPTATLYTNYIKSVSFGSASALTTTGTKQLAFTVPSTSFRFNFEDGDVNIDHDLAVGGNIRGATGTFEKALYLPTGATTGSVWTSLDSSGLGSWELPSISGSGSSGSNLAVITQPQFISGGGTATLASFTIPGGILGSSNAVRGTLYFSAMSATSPQANCSITSTYGGQATVLNFGMGSSLLPAAFGYYTIDLMASSSPIVQKTSGDLLTMASSTQSNGYIIHAKVNSSSAVDSSVGQNFTVAMSCDSHGFITFDHAIFQAIANFGNGILNATGTPNYVPVWVNSSTLSSTSSIYQDVYGNVGIGGIPVTTLTVFGTSTLQGAVNGGLNNVIISTSSAIFGNGNSATGNRGTFTAGDLNNSTRPYNVTMGHNNSNQGFAASAIGEDIIITTGGANAFVAGHGVATAANCFSSGGSCQALDAWAGAFGIATGEKSFAFGQNSEANGANSIAFSGGIADGQFAFAHGDGARSQGDYSTAIGTMASASGVGDGAFGRFSLANGTDCWSILGQCFGNDSIALLNGIVSSTAIRSIAIGKSTYVEGLDSFAFGSNLKSTGQDTLSLGQGITVNGNGSIGIGIGSNAADSFTINAQNVLAFMGGKVGVGTTTPGYLFTVAGDIQVTGTIHNGVVTTTAASNLVLGSSEYNEVNGTTQIDCLGTAGRLPGDKVILQLNDAVMIKDGQACGGAFQTIHNSGSADLSAGAGMNISYILSMSAGWRMTAQNAF